MSQEKSKKRAKCSETKESEAHGMMEWSINMCDVLINSLVHEADIGNRVDHAFTSTAYNNILEVLREKFAVNIDRRRIRNKLKSIKENFHECHDLFKDQKDFAWSPITNKWHANPESWNKLLKAKPEAKRWQYKSIHNYDKLLQLFGNDRIENASLVPLKEKKQKCSPSHFSDSLSKEKPPESCTKNAKEKVQKSLSFNSLDSTVCRETIEGANRKPSPADCFNSIAAESSGLKDEENGLIAVPVLCGSSGQGLPYAPENWPCPGDMWSWKVGNRSTTSSHWLDRSLYPPARFRKMIKSGAGFHSKRSVQQFIQNEFPNVDVDAFFSSFIWKIPCKGLTSTKGLEHSKTELVIFTGKCKAQNNNCRSEVGSQKPIAKSCQLCCTEPNFCQVCCCILCSKTVDWDEGMHKFIRCVTVVEKNFICGHVAHVECALRCYLAGTVGGNIGLDVEYYCRRCNSKTDLMPHVTQFVEHCKPLRSKDEIEQILNWSLCILHGSKQIRARNLQHVIGSAMTKFKCGVNFDEIWNMEDNIGDPASGEMPFPGKEAVILGSQHFGRNISADDFANKIGHMQHDELKNDGVDHGMISDYHNMSSKLQGETDVALNKFKHSQESECRNIETKLYAQKDLLLSSYELLESERSQLARSMAFNNDRNYETFLCDVLNRIDQIKLEEEKFENMLKIADGFSQMPRKILRQYFDYAEED